MGKEKKSGKEEKMVSEVLHQLEKPDYWFIS